MGILCQPLEDCRQKQEFSLSGASPHIIKLFYEFLRRYNELRLAKQRENQWLIIVVGLSLLALLLPWPVPQSGIIISAISLILLVLAVRQYRQAGEFVNHLGVNVHILHHHLLGKLEVGFCEHHTQCTCAEDFRRFVWKNYRISLYGGPLNERQDHSV